MNKWIAISIISVLAVGAIAPWVFYFQETDKVKDAQAEIASLEWNVFTLGANLVGAEERISILEAELAAARSTNGTTLMEVEILDNRFNPRDITVPVYTTVTWTQWDSVDHSVSSSSFGQFNAFLAFRDTFSYTFTEPGVYRYYCDIHDSMFGKIIVE